MTHTLMSSDSIAAPRVSYNSVMGNKNWFLKMASSVVGENLTTEETLMAAQNHIQQLRNALHNAQEENEKLKQEHEEALQFILGEQQKSMTTLVGTHRATEIRLQQALDEIDSLKARFQHHMGHQADENERLMKQIEWLSGTIAHDMRTPIRAIDAYTFFLEDDLGQALTDDARKSLAEVRRNGHRMSVLVEGLIEYMRISLVPVLNEAVDVGAMASVLLAEHDFTHQVNVHGSLTLRTDRALLDRALKALLDNAAKFSAMQGKPVIDVVLDAANRRIEVRDNGVGFDTRHSDKLFRLFHRLHGNDEFAGEGVGLALAQRCLQRLGANVQLVRTGDITCATVQWPAQTD